MPDVTLTCRDCATPFVFTEGEQRFFQEKGFAPPTRCAECRRRRKAEKMMNTAGANGGGRRRDW